MAALTLRPPRRSPPRPRTALGGTSFKPRPPPALIGRARRRHAAAREPHFRVGAQRAGAARPCSGRRRRDRVGANPGAAGRRGAVRGASCHLGLRDWGDGARRGRAAKVTPGPEARLGSRPRSGSEARLRVNPRGNLSGYKTESCSPSDIGAIESYLHGKVQSHLISADGPRSTLRTSLLIYFFN